MPGSRSGRRLPTGEIAAPRPPGPRWVGAMTMLVAACIAVASAYTVVRAFRVAGDEVELEGRRALFADGAEERCGGEQQVCRHVVELDRAPPGVPATVLVTHSIFVEVGQPVTVIVGDHPPADGGRYAGWVGADSGLAGVFLGTAAFAAGARWWRRRRVRRRS